MKRGDIWTVSATGFAGKPRPAVIVQNEKFDDSASITICVFTTFEDDASYTRLRIGPTDKNGLSKASYLMVDKLTTVPRAKLGKRIGVLGPDDVATLNRAMIVFLGMG